MNKVYIVEIEMDIDGGGTVAWEPICIFQNKGKAIKAVNKVNKLIEEGASGKEDYNLHRARVAVMPVQTKAVKFKRKSMDGDWEFITY